MSGTSLDGLDICYAEFERLDNKFVYKNIAAKTYPYSASQIALLKNAFYQNENTLKQTDIEFGKHIAQVCLNFIKEFQLEDKVNLIASHGHTVFHQPEKKITKQIGDGKTIRDITKINVINDFRIKDVMLGGQGAPLVPVGDHYLFSEYQACLNLGGFSNISFVHNDARIAFDISACNLPINIFSKRFFDLDFDRDGLIATKGETIPDLFSELNDLSYYKKSPPKSLGFEWLNSEFIPIVEKYLMHPPENVISTITSHLSYQIKKVFNLYKIKNVLVTGGGAYNKKVIVDLMNDETEIIVPSSEIVEFKEALIFAFLGYLNANNSINTFKSVTGASENSMGGVRHYLD